MPKKQALPAVEPSRPPLMCATAGCPYDAKVRVRRHKPQPVAGRPYPAFIAYGGWLTLCHTCDDRRHHQESVEYCNLMGLDTPAKRREWYRVQSKRRLKMLMPEQPMREPGSDDELTTPKSAAGAFSDMANDLPWEKP